MQKKVDAFGFVVIDITSSKKMPQGNTVRILILINQHSWCIKTSRNTGQYMDIDTDFRDLNLLS